MSSKASGDKTFLLDLTSTQPLSAIQSDALQRPWEKGRGQRHVALNCFHQQEEGEIHSECVLSMFKKKSCDVEK